MHPEWSPIIKVTLVRKGTNINIEPHWNDIKKSIRSISKGVLKSMETLTRWGFHGIHNEVMKNTFFVYFHK